MAATWFGILAFMLTVYAVLDGFDFGVGIVHLFVAKTDEERRTVLGAIGPLWDGNEVWLLAAGGVLVFAFPRVYAAAFSGLYLPLMIVLWLLVFRGISIEFRSKSDNPLWRSAWDATFAAASAAMALVLGVAIGNLVRGVPLDASGFFHEELFAGLWGKYPGAIDPFTAVFGLFGVAALGAHGATFLAWKTTGELNRRSRTAARRLWLAALILAVLATALTALVTPGFFAGVLTRPVIWPLPFLAMASGMKAVRWLSEGRESLAFGASSAFVAVFLVATAGALYPVMLRSTVNDAFTLDAHNAVSTHAGLVIGLALWIPAIVLSIIYFAHLFRTFRGKATVGHY
jgi:cytochrome d ubiquinol oxidase subunit II